MKRTCASLFTSGFLIFLFSSGCMKDKITHTYTIQTPVYQKLTQIRASIKSGPATPLSNIGKVYVMGNYIYLNEVDKGIHIIDNSLPSNPRNIAFINIPGNEDLAIKGSTLYANAYGDLVAFDISDLTHISPVKFLTNVFPDLSGNYSTTTDPDSITIIVGWISKDTTVDYNPGGAIIYPLGGPVLYFAAVPGAASSANNSTGTGTAGSTARFAAVNNYLYTITNSSLNVFDISSTGNPSVANKLFLGWSAETMFPLNNKLFIGTTTGVLVYDIQSSAANPAMIGECVHVNACDPVIADDRYAYVTLSDGNKCGGFSDELDIVDTKDLYYPTSVILDPIPTNASSAIIKKYPLTHPEGLSKDGSYLFICDGKDGLKVYDASDVTSLKMLDHLNTPEARDVITINGLAILITAQGLYQFDYSDINNIHLVSKISAGFSY
ncbi:MAG TPA: hypothetical protein VMH01_15960 [Puia sp.]|nr:hypothetical protein [Puia sp.]